MISRNLVGMAGIAATLIVAPRTMAASTYYIEENTDFTGNGCQSTNVNTVTALLHQFLNSSGWAGQRWTESDSWPQDWREACATSFGPGGLDSQWADTKRFAVYAGHGLIGGGNLWFGFKHDSECSIMLGTHSRLGAMDGKKVANAAYLTSCTLKTTTLAAHANFQWVHQNFGFHNSPEIPSDQAGGWFNCTATSPNSACWLTWFEADMDGDDTNTPIVVSYGVSASEAIEKRDAAQLKAEFPSAWTITRPGGPSCEQPPPAFFYAWIRAYNGTGDC